jgi:hypothetical protein
MNSRIMKGQVAEQHPVLAIDPWQMAWNFKLFFMCTHANTHTCRGVHGYRSIREPANPIQPNPLFTRTRSLAGRIRTNPPNPQVIGSDIGFEFLNPSTREPNPVIKCIFKRYCRTIQYTLLLLNLCNLLLEFI